MLYFLFATWFETSKFKKGYTVNIDSLTFYIIEYKVGYTISELTY